MSTKLARSDQRNYNDIQDLTERVKESQEANEERTSQLSEEIKNLKDINEGQNIVIQETEIQLIEKTKQLQEMVKAQNDKIQALQSQVGESTQEAKKYKKTAESQSSEVHNLRAKIDESTDQIKASKEIINSQKKTLNDLDLRLAEKTKSLTKRLEAQEETIYDLESQCQMLRDTREQHEKAIANQMEAHVRQTEKQITGIKKEYTKQAGQLKKLEQSLVSWVHKFQKVHAERSNELDRREADRQKFEQKMSTQFQILDDTNKEQQESIEAFEAFIPSIMEDFNGLRKYVKETQRQVTTKTFASLVRTCASN
jgi:chromosome segregation ATPase